MEIWKGILELNNLYEVSSYGRIRRLEHITNYIRNGKQCSRVVEQSIYDYSDRDIKRDYILVTLRSGKLYYSQYLHIIVAKAFVSNDDIINKTQVNHIDGNKHNNNANNLEWCTPSQNTKHAYNTGLADNVRVQAHLAHGKTVLQYDLDGELINIYESVRDAEKYTGISKYGIYRCCNGVYKNFHNYIWKYKS